MKLFPLLFFTEVLAFFSLQAGPSEDTIPSPNSPPAVISAFRKADKLFHDQNWLEARTAYDHTHEILKEWASPEARKSVQQSVTCSLKLQEWEDALTRAQSFTEHNRGGLMEATGERFWASLYSQIPHQGTKQGGKFLRGQWVQGVQVTSFKKDRAEAIQHLEKARNILLSLEKNASLDPGMASTPEERKSTLENERIGLNFETVDTLLNHQDFNYYGYWSWGWWWSSLEPEEDSSAVEEADYEQPRRWNEDSLGQESPTGLPLDKEGKPHFMSPVSNYTPHLGDGVKIRFLLDEIEVLDTSEKKDAAAEAVYRRALICQSLYGPQGDLQAGNGIVRYDRYGRALPTTPKTPEDEPKKKLWELDENEALTLAGGRLQVIHLPLEESPMALWSSIEKKYPHSSTVPQAIFSRAQYWQSRQQFPEAVTEYQRLIQQFPLNEDLIKQAQDNIAHIQQPGVLMESTGVYLPQNPPLLKFSYRNGQEIQFTAYRLDLLGMLNDKLSSRNQDENSYWYFNQLSYYLFDQNHWKEYREKEAVHWSEKVPLNEANRMESGTSHAPLTEPGSYVVEAITHSPSGAISEISRVLVLVTDIAILHKNLENKGLIVVVNARTGQPLANHPVRVFETWTDYNQAKKKNVFQVITSNLTTNADGAIEYKRKEKDHYANIHAIITDTNHRMAFSFFQNWNENTYQEDLYNNGERQYLITDRPVYRPGSVVKVAIWERSRENGAYQKPQDQQNVGVDVYDPKNNRVTTLNLVTNSNGIASGEFTLPADAALGLYRINQGSFRVEEYKKPEFEVTVKPAKSQVLLGEKVSTTIKARYYFGAPVAQGTIKYKIFREKFQYIYWGADDYDWLYGNGYGHYYYAYPWFPWWGRWGCFILPWNYGWYGGYGEGDDQAEMDRRTAESGTRKALRELVSQGEGHLKPDGTYNVEIDTAPAKEQMGTSDHRYTIEAEVRDASRRTITGRGDIKVTRQEFYAFAEADHGWYQPQQEAFIKIRTLTADNVPVTTQGTVTVSRIIYNQSLSTPREEEVKSWSAGTDAQGALAITYQIPAEGQYRITYKTLDSWKQEVQGNAIFWAYGPKSIGQVYRTNALEIIADKKTYQPGETAHLLVNTQENNSRLLFSDHVFNGMLLSYRFIDLPQRSTIIDVPVTEASQPNFFVEATLVRNGQVHQEMRELYVPPTKNLLKISLQTNKPVYQSGETGKVEIQLQDMRGKPVSGEVTLKAFDESVTYIQDEFGPNPQVFYHGQKRFHQPYLDATLDQIYQAFGSIDQPENQAETYFRVFLGESSQILFKERSVRRKIDDLSIVQDSAGGITLSGYVSSNSFAGEPAPASTTAPMMAKARSELDDVGSKKEMVDQDKDSTSLSNLFGPGKNVEATLRQNFSDTALWLPHLKTDAQGHAETEITFPDSLTTWRLHSYGITESTQVGDAVAHVTTTKNLIVRLQAPRFFVERDEVVLSANVHNYLDSGKYVTAELIFPAVQFEPLESPSLASDPDGNLHLTTRVWVAAREEHRFDWPVKVKQAGLAKIITKALTNEESDAMEMAFPVIVHGINKTVAQNGSYRVKDEGTREIKLHLPEQIDPEQTQLELTLSPSLGGVMVDALPYLAGYPYGCVEQTMSRFYPTILVKDALRKMGTDLETIGKQRQQMSATIAQHRFGHDNGASKNPIYDTDELNAMTRAGLRRLKSMQHDDGGWGWWTADDSSIFQTAYVLQGLSAAREAHVEMDDSCYQSGLNYLANSIQHELLKPKEKQYLSDSTTQAYLAYILALAHYTDSDERKKWLNDLYEKRGEMNNYGKALLALTFKLRKQEDRAHLILENILQFADRDDSNETAWIRTPNEGWWFWWNNDIETNAWVLKAVVSIDPKNDLSPRLVKWLLNNRKNGYYWRSTRDTAQVIAAMIDYMQASGEADPHYTISVKLDGKVVKEETVTKENFFTFDNRFVLYGLQLSPGEHTLTLEKKGNGALYYSSYLSYFTKEDDIKGAGNEIFIHREYYLLKPQTEIILKPKVTETSGWFNSVITPPPAAEEKPENETARPERRAVWDRVELHNGDAVDSGDQIEVVLKIQAKNTYDYLAFEDMKPAGCEPVDLRSGEKFAGGLCPNVELRDTKIVFYISLLEQGEHILRYKMRAENPGTFRALPTSGFAMYAPEVKAISDEMKLKIKDR